MLPNLHAILFEALPSARMSTADVRAQLEVMRELWALRAVAGCRLPVAANRRATGNGQPATPRDWQTTLAALVNGREAASPLASSLRADPALDVLRKLVWQVRAGMIVDNLTYSCRLLMLARGDEVLRALFDDYFATAPPELFGSAEAEGFGEWLAAREIDVPALDDLLAFERAAIGVGLDGERRTIRARRDPSLLMAEVAEGRIPAGIPEEDLQVEILYPA